MGRILAIDYGSKRCGIAVTDPLKIIASPMTTVPSHELMHFLEHYFSKEEVDCVVLGKAFRENNTPSDSFLLAERFASAFKKRFPGKAIAWMDERYTSRMAVSSMIEGGMKKKERRKKENIDRLSAAIILQAFLEQENNPGD
jgi:putative Holliday junction resolvase